MDYYVILARSVTYAQRMQTALERAGIRSRIFRAPRDISNLGCAYAVQVGKSQLYPALSELRRVSLEPVQIFSYENGQYREVEHDLL